MQRIRPAVNALSSGIGVEYALAFKLLYTDGAEALYDFATSEGDEELGGLTVVRTGQRQFAEVVRGYLKRITYGGDGWASRVRLPTYAHAEVVVDPFRAFGMPLVFTEARASRISLIASWPATRLRTSLRTSGCPKPMSRT